MRSLSLFAFVVVALAADVAAAADIRWLNPVSGNFNAGANWAGGVVPGAADTAIVDVAGGPFTITFTNLTLAIGALLLDSPDATFLIQGNGATAALTGSGGVEVRRGVVLLQSASAGFISNLTAGGAGLVIGAAGTVRTGIGSGGPRTISGNIQNDGVIDLLLATTFSTASGLYVNRGVLRAASTLTINGNSQRLQQVAGVLDQTGGFIDIINCTLDFQGGDVVGQPRIRTGGDLVLGAAATGTGSFHLGGASSIVGTIKAGQSVLIQGDDVTSTTVVVAAGPVRVEGTLTLRSANQGFQSRLNMGANLLTIGSSGRLSIEQGSGGDRFIFGSILNEGVVDMSFPLNLNQASVYTNRGDWNVGSTLAITGGGQLRLESGTLDVVAGGFAHVDNGSVIVTGTGGGTGRITLRASTLNIAADAAAPAAFLLGGTSHIAGTIHLGQDVLIQGNDFTSTTVVVADADVVVDGLLTMRSLNQGFQSRLNMAGRTLRIGASGRLSIEQGSNGDRFIFGNIENDGVVDVGFTLGLNVAGASYTNRGDWNVSSTMAVTGAGNAFTLAGGTLDVTGFMHVDNGAFTMTGGAVTGRPVLRSSTLTIADDAPGAANFLLGGASHIAGRVHPLQDVLIQGSDFVQNTTVVADTDILMEGLLTLRSLNQGFQSRLNMNGFTLTVAPSGRVNVESGSGGDRFIFGSVNNEGTFNVDFPLTMNTPNTLFVNSGTLNVRSTFAMTGTGDRFVLADGAINISTGFMHVDNGAFDMTGGTTTGTGVFLRNTDLSIAADAALPASFVLGGTSGLEGTIHAGQSVLIQGSDFFQNTTVVATDAIIVEGLLTLRSANQGFQSRLNLGANLLTTAPSGTVNIEGGSGGDRFIFGSINNEGTLNVAFPLTMSTANQTIVNSGTINVSSTLAVTGTGTDVVLQDGLVNVTGLFHVDNGSVTMLGGETAGQPIVLRSSALVIDDAADGVASFVLGGASSISGTINENQTVLIQGSDFNGNTTVTAPTGLVVEGTLILRSANQGFQSRLNVSGGVLLIEETGELRSEAGSGGDRFVFGNVTNEGDVVIDFTTAFQTGTFTNTATGEIGGTSVANFLGGFVNQGSFSPGDGAVHGTLSLPRSTAIAGLRVGLGGTNPGVTFDRVVVTGTATVSGLLAVELDPGYLPTQGDVFTIVTATTSVVGGFTAFSGLDLGGGAVLLVQQTATTIRLVAAQIPSFRVTTSVVPVAGEPFDLRVEARDELDVVDPAYTGTVSFSSTDPQAVLPAGVQTFSAGDSGVRVFENVVLKTSGPRAVTATDVDNPIRRGTVSVNVQPAQLSAATSTVSSSASSLEANGVATAVITVVPKDSLGNRRGPGETVSLTTTRGTLQGVVVDVGDGTYRQTFRVDTSTGSATITATVSGLILTQRASIAFVPDVTPPAAVSLARGTISGQSVPLNWSASSSLDTERYRVSIEDTAGTVLGGIDAGAGLSATATGLPACSDVRFAVQPFDFASNVGARSNVVAARTFLEGAPASPISLNAIARDSFVQLSFVPGTDCDVTSTVIQRSENSGGPYATIASFTVASGTRDVVDTLAVNGTTYFYVAVAVDGEGRSSPPGAEISATPLDGAAAEPLAGLVAAGVAGGVIELTWLPPVSDVFDRFRVYRSINPIVDPAIDTDAVIVAEPSCPRSTTCRRSMAPSTTSSPGSTSATTRAPLRPRSLRSPIAARLAASSSSTARCPPASVRVG
ncbi:MAG: Ig-like domain-containing protein [Deltaproteobacteria bacterium]|nr:Ig-like domain-containing protein [Deltaproteobacteria bacterium]